MSSHGDHADHDHGGPPLSAHMAAYEATTPARHDHGHGVSADADARYLLIALGLIVGFMVAEAVTAVISGSLALLADSGHMLTDAGALGASLWAARLATHPAVGSWSFGFKRAEILSAAGNGITLLIVSALVAFESIVRLIHPGPVAGLTVVVVAVVGVAVNVTAAGVLAKANRSSLNVEGSFQHIITDLYGFIATLIAGVILLTTGFQRADAIASLVVVVLMLKASIGLLKSSGRILLEAAPDDVDLDDVRTHLRNRPRPRRPRPSRLDRHLRPSSTVRPCCCRGLLLLRQSCPRGPRPDPGLRRRALRRRTLHLSARTRRPPRPRGRHPLTRKAATAMPGGVRTA